MSDANKTLPHSFGMPFQWITDVDGKPIIVRNQYGEDININQLVENFKYKFSDEKDDTCNIKIGITDQYQIDHPKFQIDTKLIVQWGYVLPKGEIIKSRPRTVAIRDTEKHYKADGITLELICTDLVAYLRTIRANNTSKRDNFGDWLREILNGQFTATKTIKGKMILIATKGKKAEPIEKPKPKPLLAGQRASKELTLEEDVTRGMMIGQQNESINADNKNAAANKFDLDNFPKLNEKEPILKGYEVGRAPTSYYTGKGKAIDREIQERLDTDPGGPFHLNTRDDQLNIIKRDFNQTPFVEYSYKGGHGELIEFKPKTQVVKTKKDDTESNYVNPVSKKVETTRIVKNHDNDIDLPPGATKFDVEKVFAIAKGLFENNVVNPLNQLEFAKKMKVKRTVKFGDHANGANPDGDTRVATKKTIEFYQEFNTKDLIMTPYFDKLQRQNFLNNYIEKKLERKFEADAKVIGDPSLVNCKVYRMLNLPKVDGGNWYASDVEHEIDDKTGYTCHLTLLKKPQLIATLIEEREYDAGDSEMSSPNYQESINQFSDNESVSSFNSSTSVQDMGLRLDALTEQENLLQGGNDIAFINKTEVDNTTPFKNATET